MRRWAVVVCVALVGFSGCGGGDLSAADATCAEAAEKNLAFEELIPVYVELSGEAMGAVMDAYDGDPERLDAFQEDMQALFDRDDELMEKAEDPTDDCQRYLDDDEVSEECKDALGETIEMRADMLELNDLLQEAGLIAKAAATGQGDVGDPEEFVEDLRQVSAEAQRTADDARAALEDCQG